MSASVRDDGRVVAPSSTTNTVHSIALDAALTVSEDRSCDVSATGPAPFHARWIEGGDFAVTDVNADGSIHVVDTSTCR